MSVQVRRRREAAAFLASFVGAQGELLVDTTNNRVQVHDGTTPGGWPAAKLSEVVQWVPPQGRLTLQSATPVMNAAVAAATSILYTPYVGSFAGVWNGTTFVPVQFAEVGQALSDTAKSPAAAAAGNLYDMFGWMDGTTFRVTRGPAWTAGATAGSNTARGAGAGSTALTRVQGVMVNQYAITNGPAAGYGTYLGTIATDSGAATCSFTLGGSASGGKPATLNVWNAFNRVAFRTLVNDSTSSWTAGAARPFNGSTNNRVDFVSGLAIDGYQAAVTIREFPAGNTGALQMGIGVDSSTALTSNADYYTGAATAPAVSQTCNCVIPALLGFHSVYCVENQYYQGPFSLYGGSNMTFLMAWSG